MGKRILSWIVRTITILLIIVLLLGSGAVIAASVTGREGVLGYQIYLPTDTQTDFAETAVIVKVEDRYLLGDTVLFPTVDGVKTATITAEGEIYHLSIGDTGEFYAAAPDEILGRVLFYSYFVGTVFSFLTENWIIAAAGAFLLFCILLALLLLLSLKGRKRQGQEEPSAEKTPKIVDEQIAYEEKEEAPLEESAGAEQAAELVTPQAEAAPPAQEEKKEDTSAEEPSEEAFPSKEEVQKLLEQETGELPSQEMTAQEVTLETPEPMEGSSGEAPPEEAPPEAEPPKEESPEEEFPEEEFPEEEFPEEEFPEEEFPLPTEMEISTELPPPATEAEAPKSEEPAADAIPSVSDQFAELEKELEAFKASLLNDDK